MSNNIKLYTKRSIKLQTVETATHIVYLAILIEKGGEEIIYSEPKIVKIVNKQILSLNGQIGFRLSGNIHKTEKVSHCIVSPYFQNTEKEEIVLDWYGARPPCLNK